MNCGIMDQFISVHGQKGHALFLDCRSLDYRQVPLPSDRVSVVVCDTMVKHELAGSEYNRRREECAEGVALLREIYPSITALRDVSPEELAEGEGSLPETVRKRCRHVVAENRRVLDSVAALEKGDLERFGSLMIASHASLRNDYEVSCRELDALVDIACRIPELPGRPDDRRRFRRLHRQPGRGQGGR